MAATNPTTDGVQPLQVLPILLSALHLDSNISSLDRMSGVELSLPKSDRSVPVTFKAIIQDSTSCSLILDSFYRAHIAGEKFDGDSYPKALLKE